jgi:hypothetical protein
MSTEDELRIPDAPPGFARTYGVELLYEAPPVFDRPALDAAVKALTTNVERPGGDDPSAPLVYVHLDHVTTFADGKSKAQTAVVPGEAVPDLSRLNSALEHTYDWPGAREAVNRARASVLVTDLLSSSLPYAVRLNLLESVLLGVIEVAPPLAIHWQPSGKIVDPAALRRHLSQGPAYAPLHGAVNVRMFQIAGTEHDILMDTLGLAALGLADLQIHFRHLDPNKVAGLLFNYAHYLFAKGDVIEDGNTIQGIEPGQKWVARHELSLIEPQRVVIDLDPGEGFAAGNRE